ncbi:hypothetical protein JCM10213_005201 [Rhodosporidiobolus nylandii]
MHRLRPPAVPPIALSRLYTSSNPSALPQPPSPAHPTSSKRLASSRAAPSATQLRPRKGRLTNATREPYAREAEADEGNPPIAAKEAYEASERPQGIRLRPYQTECIRAVLDELDRGEFQRLGVSAPTGSGKTAIFSSLIHYLPPLIHPGTGQHATRVLIIVNSIQLATQTAAVVRRTYPGMSVEVEQGNKRGTGMADVTVGTYQTLARGELSRLDKFDPDYLKAIIVDEAHHAIAPSYLSILSRFDSHILSEATEPEAQSARLLADHSVPLAADIIPAPSPSAPPSSTAESELAEEDDPSSLSEEPLPALPEPEPAEEEDPFDALPAPYPCPAVLDAQGRHRVPLLAFSATWGRADGLALGKVWEKLVWHAEWLDMIEASWLSPVRFTTVHLGSALDYSSVNVSQSTGEFTLGSLAKAVDKTEINKIIADTWEEKAGDRRSTLVFAINVNHVISLTNTFRERGIDARFVYEATKPREREELYEQFRAGEFPILVNCGILTEGADFPFVDCVLLARPTRSQNLFLQMLGRGLRLSSDTGKSDCLVIDLVGASAQGVVCTPTLFGLSPDEKIEGQSSSDLQRRGLELALESADHPSEADAPRKLSAAAFAKRFDYHYRDYTSAFDLVAQEKKKTGETEYVSVSRLSRLAWVGVGDESWVLELMGHGHLKIVRENVEYVASFYRKVPGDRGFRTIYATPKIIATHRILPILLRTTDAWVLNNQKMADLSLARHHAWRRSESSKAQQDFLLGKLGKEVSEAGEIDGVWVGRPYKERMNVRDLTKGQASDILARLMHGGKAVWTKSKKVLEREERKEEKEREKARTKMEKQLAKVKALKAEAKKEK